MRLINRIIIYLYFHFTRLSLLIAGFIIFLIFSIISAVIFQSHDVFTDPVGWAKPAAISPAGVESKNVSTVRRGNLVAAVYEGESGGVKNIYASISFDGGISFIDPVVIAQFDSNINNNPRIAVSSTGVLHVMWHVLSGEESESRIYTSVSTDMGATWTSPAEISFGLQLEMLPIPLFDDMDDLHLFFTAYKEGQFNLFHSAKRGKSTVFSNARPLAVLSGNIRGAFFPSVKFDGRKGIIVWQSKEESFVDHLYSVRSDNYGQSWSRVTRITTGRHNNQAPSIEIFDDTVYLVFMNNSERNWGIRLLKGYNMGARWDEESIKISETNANCYAPHISLGPDNELLIMWHDLRERGSRIFYRKYSIRSRELLPELKLSMRNNPARNPVGLRTGRNLTVFWEESGRVVRNHTDITVDPPVVFSRTHPENRWSKSTEAVIEWSRQGDDSGIAGYATLVDNNPESIPSIQNYRHDVNRAYLTGLNDGITYFHIRSIDGAGNMSRTVHYKIQVSANPLAMPLVVSPTHPENEKSLSKDASFRWVVNDSRRLKGFLYSLEKDRSRKPDKFIQDFGLNFDELEKGVYFFNIAAVSKTDQVSRVTTYSFIVGDEADFDPDYMKDLSDKDFDMTDDKRIARPRIPYLEITFPFDNVYNKKSFKAIITPVNIRRDLIEGYSLVFAKDKKLPINRINHKSEIIQFSDLKNGTYTIGVKARYYRVVNGQKRYYWTEPSVKTFTIDVPLLDTPVDRLYDVIARKLKEAGPAAIPLIFLIFVIVIVWGFGSRIVFYYKLLNYNIKLLLTR